MEKRITAQMGACFDTINDISLNITAPIFIIGATNRPDNIDNSLRRPGRFDRELEIGMPNEKMREEMLLSMSKQIKLADDISISDLVQMTPGFLPADLLALIKQSAYFAVDRIENNKKVEIGSIKEITGIKGNNEEKVNIVDTAELLNPKLLDNIINIDTNYTNDTNDKNVENEIINKTNDTNNINTTNTSNISIKTTASNNEVQIISGNKKEIKMSDFLKVI